MKKSFTKSYLLSNRGCFTKEQAESVSFINQKTISINNILDSELKIQDKIWFLFRKTEMLTNQKVKLSLLLAESVEYIYRQKYPEDNRVKECLEATNQYLLGNITIDELRIKRSAAYDAADAAYAYAAYAASAAAYASAAAASDVISIVKNFIKNA